MTSAIQNTLANCFISFELHPSVLFPASLPKSQEGSVEVEDRSILLKGRPRPDRQDIQRFVSIYIFFIHLVMRVCVFMPFYGSVFTREIFLRSMSDFVGAEDSFLKSKQAYLPPVSLSGRRLRGCALRLKIFSVLHASHLSHRTEHFYILTVSHLTVSDVSA
jgi:hypothetical protein